MVVLSFTCQQTIDDSASKAALFHGVEALDGAAAWSSNLINGSLRVFACFLKQLYGSLDGLQDNLLGILSLESHFYAAFHIGSYIAHGVSDGTRHSGSLIMEERLFPAATAMSCAIAYAMRYVRANVEGGVEMGFKAKDAQKIVLQTIKGAVELLQETGEHPEAAIDKVTTPGGCTIKGLNTMEQGGFTSAVINGLLAGKK